MPPERICEICGIALQIRVRSFLHARPTSGPGWPKKDLTRIETDYTDFADLSGGRDPGVPQRAGILWLTTRDATRLDPEVVNQGFKAVARCQRPERLLLRRSARLRAAHTGVICGGLWTPR